MILFAEYSFIYYFELEYFKLFLYFYWSWADLGSPRLCGITSSWSQCLGRFTPGRTVSLPLYFIAETHQNYLFLINNQLLNTDYLAELDHGWLASASPQSSFPKERLNNLRFRSPIGPTDGYFAKMMRLGSKFIDATFPVSRYMPLRSLACFEVSNILMNWERGR